jgi:ATP-dependent RNA helicase HelY
MKLIALSTSGRVVPLGRREVPAGTQRSASVELPKPFAPKDRRFQQDALRLLRKLPTLKDLPPIVPPPRIQHPVASCPQAESHLRWARKAVRTHKRVEQLRVDFRQTGMGLVEDFRAIQKLLTEFGYMEEWRLTPRGERLRFIYNELDLLLSEALERGLFWDLAAEEMVALASCFVYEPRAEEPSLPGWATERLAQQWEALEGIWLELTTKERALRLPLTRAPDPGFASLSYRWALGFDLEDLEEDRLQPGDFVRVARQLVDLIRQLRDVAPEIEEGAKVALTQIDRGVVAAMGVG